MREQIAVAKTYGDTLIEMAKVNERVFVLDADLCRSSGTELFGKTFPDRAIQVGLAEQNMIGVAAGLATCGKIPFANTFGVFASRRACDQVAISVALNRLNVRVCGSNAGLTSALNGATHQALEDVAIMRALPGMTVIDPSDTLEVAQVVRALCDYEGPVYLRMARGTMARCLPDDYKFTLGKAVQLRGGKDVTLMSAGITMVMALDAAEMLAGEGIDARVLNVSTLKPLDREAVLKAAAETGAIVTVENHNIVGGLGSAVAELLAEELPTPMKRVGVEDRWGDTANMEWLLEAYGLSPANVVRATKALLERKR